MARTPATSEANRPPEAQELLERLAELEAQHRQVRASLTHSHRLATLGTIATIIAHEYNNILTPVISYAQLALANPEDRALNRKAVERALSGAERAARISSSLLGFAQEEQDEAQPADLRVVIQETLACLGRDLSKDGIRLELDTPDAGVAMDPLSLQQVLLNLILNARKAMRPRGGTLVVRGQAGQGRVRLEVTDTGPGIPRAVRDRLFEPFVTQPVAPDESNDEPRGTGLGLSICRELVDAAGGTIHAESPPAGGTTFRLDLPAASNSTP